MLLAVPAFALARFAFWIATAQLSASFHSAMRTESYNGHSPIQHVFAVKKVLTFCRRGGHTGTRAKSVGRLSKSST